ncbi:MAG: PAS domain S-box protein [bacterium]
MLRRIVGFFNKMVGKLGYYIWKLRDSGRRYRLLAENISDMIFSIDGEGRFSFVNPRCESLLGYSPEELLGRPFVDIVAPEMKDMAQALISRGLRGKANLFRSLDIHLLNGAGDRLVAEVDAVRAVSASGSPEIYGVARDISRRRRMELDIIKSAERLMLINRISSMIASSLDVGEILQITIDQLARALRAKQGGIVLFDRNMEYRRVVAEYRWERDSTAERIEIPLRGALGLKHILETHLPLAVEDAVNDPLMASVRDIVELRRIKSILIVPIIVKGEVIGTIGIDSIDEPRKFSDDEIELVQTVANQVSIAVEKARLFEEVSRAKSEWENTFDSISDMIFIHDGDFNILRANRALADRLGMSPEGIVGRKCYEVLKCSREVCPYVGVMESGGTVVEEFENFPWEGVFEITAAPIRGHEGSIVGSVHVIRDITEQKRLERHLLQSEKMSALGGLVAGAAHELNNPLTGVMGFAQLLLMDPNLDEGTKADIEKINREADRAGRIVRSLLAFARSCQPEKRPVDINGVVVSALESCANDMRASNVEVVKDFHPALPTTMADSNQLRQAFSNIINNAIHAMLEHSGGGTLTVKTNLVSDMIKVEFSDTGPGIPRENLNKIFDPFFTTREVGKGVGLGLSVSYGIVREHNGRIYAENRLGGGARFTVELPIISNRE